MRVVGVDTELSVPNFTRTRFTAATSLLDFDVAVWDPHASYRDVVPSNAVRRSSAPVLGEHASADLHRTLARRRSEIVRFIEAGRTLVVYVAAPKPIWVVPEDPRISPVLAAKVQCSLTDALPFSYEATDSQGGAIEPVDAKFNSVFRIEPHQWGYRAILDKFPGTPLATVAGTPYAVGSIATFAGGGRVILLPKALPQTQTSRPRGGNVILDITEVSLLKWIEEMKVEATPSFPSWAVSYKLPEQLKRSGEMARVSSRVDALLDQLEKLKAADAEDEQWKVLITGTGAALEAQVSRAFEKLGFTIEPVASGRSDLRVSHGGRLAVVEVKGVVKSASEKNAAQLEKWVAHEVEAGRLSPKPILIVNSWRDRPLEERTEPNFPKQMLGYSIARGHCLLSGLQLLAMVRVASDPSEISRLADLFFDTVGIIPGFDTPSNIFAAPE